ncbi:hypothetical protein B2J93_8668 [Marssonina coronariae]|uniref:Uncharacterized protein n=1 Tax=Diplocarpon coronariae TaxID=2795749 RepID=A0A218YWC5_9HELO|nr:hypothetical protein B2J93_8668 [Marssonina coronariae]
MPINEMALKSLAIQPTHATSDKAYALDRLGPERLADPPYRMASFFSGSESPPASTSQSKLAGPVLGSNVPVELPSPSEGICAAVARLNPYTGTSLSGPGGWHPEQARESEPALLGFARNAAYGWERERETGAIEMRYWAGWVVLDRDFWLDATGKGLRDVRVRDLGRGEEGVSC